VKESLDLFERVFIVDDLSGVEDQTESEVLLVGLNKKNQVF